MLDSSRNISESLKNNTNTLATMELKILLKKKKKIVGLLVINHQPNH